MVVDTESMTPSQPVAIVGIGCRFPGDVTSPSKLWNLCVAGQDGCSAIPKDRFNVKSLYDADRERVGRSHVLVGYFLKEDVAHFDADFFNLPADIASAMDPQIRLLLEIVYEATEDAGIPIEKLAGSNTSVFSGCSGRDYHDIQVKDPETLPPSGLTGNSTMMFANRVSQFYDLQGPSMTIDTGCSSGLVALHQGCQTIHSGESDISIVGASSIIMSEDMFTSLPMLGKVNPEGKCYAWDARAQGYSRGEGVAALILKSFDAAIKDGDHVHAVIRDTGINHDGKTTTITSPSMAAQIKLIETCYKRAGLDLSETGYVEAHMTGTKVGDAVEAEALAKTFGKSRASDPILVGSVKTNIGHTEAVSGLAAIIKTAFTLKYSQIVPNLNFEETNPEIDLDKLHLRVPTRLTDWPQGKPLRASINSFGYGGTNVHVILEGAPPINPRLVGMSGHSSRQNGTHGSNRHRVYVLSAKDSAACLKMAKNIAIYLRRSNQEGHEPCPGDLAYTLLERRSHLPWVVAIRTSNLDELAQRLEQPTVKPLHATKQPSLGFVFNGQGAQWYAMGRELITTYPVFSASIHKAGQILKDYGATWSLYDELMLDEHSTRVAEIDLSQTMSVALQLCLVDLLKSWGITPSAVTSHSSGEIAAAYAVSALSFKEALGVVYLRGELTLKHQKSSSLAGGMLAAGIDFDQAERYAANTTSGRVVVACVNSPESTTLSGDLSALNEIASRLEMNGLFARQLEVPLAYHSHHMVPMAQEYVDNLRDILSKPAEWNDKIMFLSPVTGGILSPKFLTPDYWARNLTDPVLFSEAFETMCRSDANVDLVVEIGAHSTLAAPIRQLLSGRKISYVPCLKKLTDAVETMQDLVCELLARGYPVDLKAVNSPSGEEQQAFTPNLPRYPWNHSTRYWAGSGLSKETRRKKFPPHELLGLPIPGCTGPTPTWRNFMRLSDLSWLVDHQVDSKIVLPAAAYISMAIEAVRFLTESVSTLRGFRLRQVNVINALTIPELSDSVEVHTHLRPSNENELDHKGWYEFEVNSISTSDSWIKNCHGFVSAETDKVNRSQLFRETENPCENSFFAAGAKVQDLDVKTLYATMQEMKIYYGSAFQNLLDGLTAGGKTITSLSISSVASKVSDYVIHPTTLETIIQAAFGGLPNEFIRNRMILPRSIGNMFVPYDLKRQAGSRLKAFTDLRKLSQRGFASNVAVSGVNGDGSMSPYLRMEDLYCKAVPTDLRDVTGGRGPPLCFKSHWEHDILHQIPAAVKDSMKNILSDEETKFETKLLRSSYHFIYDAVAELKDKDRVSWAWHHKKYYDWMEHIVALGISGALSPGCKVWSRSSKGMKQMLYDELRVRDASGRLTVRVGEQLGSILRGEITPLNLMMEGNLLQQYYMEIPRLRNRIYKHLKRIVEFYAVKNPGADVLEIGAGTGGATQTVLEAFSCKGDGSGSLLGRYTFTDVSAGSFEAASQKLAPWTSMMDFAKLNIEFDPVEQSFAANSYDLIVASMALHETASLHKTMSHIRKLLKPGGKVLLVENTKDRLDMQLIFGTLPSWWLSQESFRKHSPNASLENWEDVLKATGFTGIDFHIDDCEQTEFQSSSIILTTATTTPAYPSLISIVYTTPLPLPWITQLTKAIEHQTSILPTVERLDEIKLVQDKVCIFTAEMNAPFVDGIDRASFHQLQKLLLNSKGVLWLSCGSIVDAKLPAIAQTQGLLRTLRLEHSTSRYIQLDFEQSADLWSEDKIKYILHVLQHAFDYNKEHADIEWEYAVKDSILHVPRVYEDKHIANTSIELVPRPEPFHQSGRTLVWEPPTSGLLSDFYFTDSADRSGNIPSGMVQIEAKAFGLSFREVMIALGQLDDTLIGHDCAGVVTRLGHGTEQSGLKLGDRVCGIAQGFYANESRAYWTAVTKLPDDMPWEDGAAIPIAYISAYHSLIRVASLRKGESVLIHAAAGSVGQAAIVVAQHVGAEIFVTCSTGEKRDLLVEKYHIKPTRIFSSRDTSFTTAIMTATEGKGVNVVLNSLSGPLLKATWSCIARFGRFVEIGKVDIEAARCLDMTPFGRCAMYVGVDMLQVNEYNGLLVREALAESVRICHARGTKEGMRPVYPIQQYSISDMEKAMKQMQSGLHVGKLVFVPREEDKINVVTRPRPLSLANPDTTYLIADGMGEIGRGVAVWMMKKGATNILVVSRHAESHPSAVELVQMAKNVGCNLHIRNCDVSSEDSFVKLLTHCSSASLPPIRGVINCTMVLDDTILEQMTFEQWQRAVQARVWSSTNLHKHLSNVSFFVMLSSMVGVAGHVSQASCSAGSAFQDALARHRTACVQPAVSLDIPAISDKDYVATKDFSYGDSRVRRRVKTLDVMSLDVGAIIPLIEIAVLRSPQRDRPDDAQIIIGIAPWDHLSNGAVFRQDRRFGTLCLNSPRGTPAAAGGAAAATSPTDFLVRALEKATERTQSVAEALAKRLAVIFNISAEEIDPAVPMTVHGVDSLVAVELRNWLSGAAKAKISIFEITQSSSLMEFAGLIVKRSQLIR